LPQSYGVSSQINQGEIKKFTSNKSKKSDSKSPASQGSFLDI